MHGEPSNPRRAHPSPREEFVMTDDSNIYVTIDQQQHPVLCGLCKNAIASRAEVDTPDDVGCVICDTRATNEEVLEAVQKYFQDQHQNEIIRQLGETARGSKFITFDGKPVRNTSYKFIV
tara:strand:- start:2367 stop:2726 length:360 start_codon:yes stop_codon:yes gene_type:complete